MYSAKKVKGKALYKYARKGIEIERKEEIVNIFEVLINKWKSPFLNLGLHVSKGTYIRVLGSDIAKSLGTVGHLSKLVRTSVGEYLVEDANQIEEFEKQWKNISA